MSGAAGGAIAGLLIANAIREKQEAQALAIAECHSDAWKKFAEERGFALTGRGDHPVVSAQIRGVACALSIELDRTGWAHTRATASAPKPAAQTVGVYPNPGGVLGFLKSHLQEDILVGDEAFDQAFLVRADPDSAAQALLGPKIREHLTALSGRGFSAFSYEKGHVTIQMAGVEKDAQWLAAALEVVVEAALWEAEAKPAT